MTAFLIQVIQSQKTFCQLIKPVGLKHYDLQILFLKFRRNGTVQNGFCVPFNRGQRGTEVVGNIGNKFPLITAGHIQFVRHIIQSQGQIAQFIFFIQRYVIFQIPGGKGIRTLNDLFQRPVDHKGEYRNDHSQNSQKNEKQNVDDVQDVIPFFVYHRHGKMDGHISLYPHIYGNRHHDA